MPLLLRLVFLALFPWFAACTTTRTATQTPTAAASPTSAPAKAAPTPTALTEEQRLLQAYARTRYSLLQYLASLLRLSAQESGSTDDIKIRWPDPKGLPFLIDLIKNSKEWEIRWASIKLVGELNERAVSAVPVLLEAMRLDPRWEIEVEGASSLGRIGPKAHTALGFLLQRFEQGPARWESRRGLCFAFWKIGASHPPSHAALLKATEDPASEVQLLAIVALADLTPLRPPIGDRLIQLLAASLWQIRAASALTLGKIGDKLPPPPTIQALIRTLADPHPHVRLAAVIAIGKLKDHAASAKGPLLALQKDPNDQVRQASQQIAHMLP